MKLTEQRLREIVREQLISLEEGIKGYFQEEDKLYDDTGYQFDVASAESYEWMSDKDQASFTELIDYSDSKKGLNNLIKFLSKYLSKLGDYGIKDKVGIENYAKWLSPESHKISESAVTEGKVWTLVSSGNGFYGGNGTSRTETTYDLKLAMKFKDIKQATKVSKELAKEGFPNMVHVMNESLVNEGPDYSEAKYQMDKIFGDDQESIEKFQDIEDNGTVEDMIDYINNWGDEDRLADYGIKSDAHVKKFAKKIMENAVTEGAPKMAKNVEAENIQDLMNRVANAQKGGGSGRYGKEFDKAKTKALRAIKDMVTYSQIGR